MQCIPEIYAGVEYIEINSIESNTRKAIALYNILQAECAPTRVPLPIPDGEFDIDKLTNEECRQYFRFDKCDILRLPGLLRLPSTIILANNHKVSVILATCILLRRLAYPNRLVDLVKTFYCSTSTISRIFNHMIERVYEDYKHLLLLDVDRYDQKRLQTLADTVFAKSNVLNNCIGFVDGTVRPICRPSQYQRQAFNGHKRVHAIKFQSVVTPDGLIADLTGPWVGKRHDARMLRESKLLDRLSRLSSDREGKRFIIYGDPAYFMNEFTVAPFKKVRNSPIEDEFNRRMSSVRQAVEWEFGKIIELWKFLDFKKNLKVLLQPVGKLYVVGAFLTNLHTCMYGNQTSTYFCLPPPTVEEYLGINISEATV